MTTTTLLPLGPGTMMGVMLPFALHATGAGRSEGLHVSAHGLVL